MSITYRF